MKEHMTPTGDTGLVRLDRWTMGPKEPTENSPCSSGVVDMASWIPLRALKPKVSKLLL